MGSVFDLHIHTVRGSSDSSLRVDDLLAEAKRLGLTGVCLTEHGAPWPREEVERLSRQHGLVVVRGMEVETIVGHVLVFGLEGYAPGFSDLQELHRAVRRSGGFLVLAHPFRGLFAPPGLNRNMLYKDSAHAPMTPQEASRHPAFSLVDEMEVVNGANSEEENRFAWEVARLLGRRGTGGSDAHSLQGLGRAVTVFQGEVRTEGDFLEALRAGAFYPAEGPARGPVRPFGEGLGLPSP